jgi:two-component system, NtrC family, response regulator
MANLLVVDDDPLVCDSLALVIQHMGHVPFCARTVSEAIEKVRAQSFDVVFCDVRMPDGSGLDILPELKASQASPEVIIITGFGDAQGAELAIKKGAWDYVEKPLSAKEVTLSINRALQYREKKQAVNPTVALNLEGIIGNSALLRACFNGLAQAASSDSNVLITGETGTGKELFAGAIHNNSGRAKGRFVVVDCAALPETLVESTLFGHVRGAFTGADRPRDGLIKQADGGTLFLDEVGELPFSIQKAFLRVLQEKRFRPVGGGQEVTSDFRLVAATNRHLEDMVEKGAFREDLLFRLRTLMIELPPLKAYKEDIKTLALHYVAKFCEQYRVPIKGFSSDFFEALIKYDWPGNVRELIQALEKAVVTAQNDPTLFLVHLPDHIRIKISRAVAGRKGLLEQTAGRGHEMSVELTAWDDVREDALAKIERQYLTQLVENVGGNIGEACRISGLSRSRFYALLKKHKIPLPR